VAKTSPSKQLPAQQVAFAKAKTSTIAPDLIEAAALTDSNRPAARAPPAPLGARLLSKREVLAIVGVSYPTVWAMMRAGTFPRARVVGGKSMWLSSEIEAWLAALPVRQLKGDAPTSRLLAGDLRPADGHQD
jgi:predicted DNA-binding transcriptional regulator AlpA